MRRHVLLLVLALAAPVALAQSPVCHRDGNQAQLNQCAFDELGNADAALNAAYAKALTSVDGQATAQRRLKAAQRLWIQLRDADLAAQFPLDDGENPQYRYGSIYPLEYADAQTELTRQRTAYLRAHFPDRAGDAR